MNKAQKIIESLSEKKIDEAKVKTSTVIEKVFDAASNISDSTGEDKVTEFTTGLTLMVDSTDLDMNYVESAMSYAQGAKDLVAYRDSDMAWYYDKGDKDFLKKSLGFAKKTLSKEDYKAFETAVK